MKTSRRKMLDKHISKRVLKALYKDNNFADCYQIACNNSKEQPYLVGGKLFRTIIEVIYEHPARASSCDYDFATASIIKRKKKKKKKIMRGRRDGESLSAYIAYKERYWASNGKYKKQKSPYSGTSRKFKTRNGAQIDIIDISSLEMIKNGSYPASIDGYLRSVPLSIQSLAMNIDRCEIFGSVGIDSINERFIWINSEEGIVNLCKNKGWIDKGYRYVDGKARSIRFRHDVTRPENKKVLTVKPKLRYTGTQDFFSITSNTATTSTGGWYSYGSTT